MIIPSTANERWLESSRPHESKPKVSYKEGFKRTIDWYFANKNREEVKGNMKKLFMER